MDVSSLVAQCPVRLSTESHQCADVRCSSTYTRSSAVERCTLYDGVSVNCATSVKGAGMS